jgi:hypothetical protein
MDERMPLINIKIYGRNGFAVSVGIVPFSLPFGARGTDKRRFKESYGF